MQTTEEFPLWKEVVKRFVAEGFEEGQIVPHDWFEGVMHLTRKRQQDNYFDEIGRVKMGLAQLHGIVLIAVPNEGYRYLPNEEVPTRIGSRTDESVRRRVNIDTMLLVGAAQKAKTQTLVQQFTERIVRNGRIAHIVDARKTKRTIREIQALATEAKEIPQ